MGLACTAEIPERQWNFRITHQIVGFFVEEILNVRLQNLAPLPRALTDEGDVQLGSVPSDSAFLFVPTEQEASRLSRISAWPVVVWPGAT